MTTNFKEKLLQAIEQAPDPVLEEALHYLEYLTERHIEALELQEDLEDLQIIREEIQREGTIPLAQFKAELGLS
jgi:hypothetical protein